MELLLMSDRPNVICTSCKSEIHWLDVFPNEICLNCHERKHFNDSPEQLMADIFNGFGKL
jgi:hypothetical protein